jgi:hypothetical protein
MRQSNINILQMLACSVAGRAVMVCGAAEMQQFQGKRTQAMQLASSAPPQPHYTLYRQQPLSAIATEYAVVPPPHLVVAAC